MHGTCKTHFQCNGGIHNLLLLWYDFYIIRLQKIEYTFRWFFIQLLSVALHHPWNKGMVSLHGFMQHSEGLLLYRPLSKSILGCLSVCLYRVHPAGRNFPVLLRNLVHRCVARTKTIKSSSDRSPLAIFLRITHHFEKSYD